MPLPHRTRLLRFACRLVGKETIIVYYFIDTHEQLHANPATAAFMRDPAFVEKLNVSICVPLECTQPQLAGFN